MRSKLIITVTGALIAFSFPAAAFEWQENYGQLKKFGWYQRDYQQPYTWRQPEQPRQRWAVPGTDRWWGYDEKGRYESGTTQPRQPRFCFGQREGRVCD